MTVGLGKCEVLDLQTNQLVCRPPKTKPALGQFHKHGNPRVKVRCTVASNNLPEKKCIEN